MSRGQKGKLKKLSAAEKAARAERNKRRNRVPRVIKWEKEHVEQGAGRMVAAEGKHRGTKASRMVEKVVAELRSVPSVEDARGGGRRGS